MNTLCNLRSEIERDFVFRLRAEPIPGDLRPVWRIAMLVLMLLRAGHGRGMSLKKALILNWGVRTAETREALLRMIEGRRRLEDIPVRFDPALNRALHYAAAEGLVNIESKTTGSVISMQSAGEIIANLIYKTRDCMETEKAFFDRVRGRMPETKVKELLDWEATI